MFRGRQPARPLTRPEVGSNFRTGQKNDSYALHQAGRAPFPVPLVVLGRLCLFSASRRGACQPSQGSRGHFACWSDGWASLDGIVCCHMVPSHTWQHSDGRQALWPLAKICPDHHQMVRSHFSRHIRGVLRSRLAAIRLISTSLVTPDAWSLSRSF